MRVGLIIDSLSPFGDLQWRSQIDEMEFRILGKIGGDAVERSGSVFRGGGPLRQKLRIHRILLRHDDHQKRYAAAVKECVALEQLLAQRNDLGVAQGVDSPVPAIKGFAVLSFEVKPSRFADEDLGYRRDAEHDRLGKVIKLDQRSAQPEAVVKKALETRWIVAQRRARLRPLRCLRYLPVLERRGLFARLSESAEQRGNDQRQEQRRKCQPEPRRPWAIRQISAGLERHSQKRK